MAILGTTNHYVAYTYDAAGNVLSDGKRTFAYDPLSMMTRAQVSGRDFRYVYSADDERIAAVERVSGGNRTTWTLHGFDNQLLSEWTDDWTSGSEVTTWREDEIWRGSQLLANESSAYGTRHYVLDHLGSPRQIANSAGHMIGSQDFTPFGAGGTSNGGALQFTGHERDQASLAGGTANLPDNMHARYYDSALGRFLSVDPELDVRKIVHAPQMWNRYAYVLNNPMRYTDPAGTEADPGELNGMGNKAFDPYVEAYASFVWSAVHAEDLKEAFTGFRSASLKERLIAGAIGVISALDVSSNFIGPEKAPVAKGAVMLGHFPEYLEAGAKVNAKVFNIPGAIWNKMSDAARWTANQKFLDRAINRGATLLLATDPAKIKAGSYLSKEVEYLLGKGYKLLRNANGLWSFVPR